MRAQFLRLIALQHLDDQLRALLAEQDDLPHQLRPFTHACATARQELAQLHEGIEETERQRRLLERELDNSQAQLVKTQQKLREVKTNKEYSAVLTEIDAGREHITTLEDQVLELMELAEQHRQACRQQELRVHAAEQELVAQEQQVEQARQSLGAQISAEEHERRQLVTDLDAQFYATYQRVVALRDGQAVVLLQNGTCGGCYLKVQPQLISEIRRQDRLMFCPHCQRVLLWPVE